MTKYNFQQFSYHALKKKKKTITINRFIGVKNTQNHIQNFLNFFIFFY